MSRSLRASLVAVALLVCLAPPADAQEDGVYVDPGSPTGKEYAIPLDSARRQADPSGGGAGAAPGTAPLFGTGITADPGSDSAATGSGDPASDPAAPGSGDPGPDTDAPAREQAPSADGGADSEEPASSDDAAVVEAATQNPGAPAGGLGTPAVIALMAGGLLLAGGLAGVLIRRARG